MPDPIPPAPEGRPITQPGMHDGTSPTERGPHVSDESSPSPLGERLSASLLDVPPPPALLASERETIAAARVGATLKGWRLGRLLGTGPITAAYEATRGAADAPERATVKLMIGELATHEGARAHFIRSAYAANRFHHGRVLPIMADGTDEDGAPFVVRVWTDAVPFDAWLETKSAAAGEPQILRVAEQVLDALEIAHAHGIVHGAISPQNILVTARGSMRLCDFATPPGLGTRVSDEGDVLAQRRLSPYMAPERCATPPAMPSEQSDVYAVGACLYFALAKAPPRGEAAKLVGVASEVDAAAALAKATTRPLREIAPSVSDPLARVVDHAMNPNPKKRYESAYAMLGDVRRVMAGRMPKLGDAHRPVPSGSYADLAAMTAAARKQPPSTGRLDIPKSGAHAGLNERTEWRGNVVLIMAIALLVGVATFVIVREKLEDTKASPHPAPSAAAP